MGCWTPPFGNPQVLAGAVNLAELLAACAAGASVPLGKAASACALATAAAPPPLRGGGCAPLPPAFPVRKSLPVMRACWGLRPFAPKVPQRGKSADHARQRMVPRPLRLLRATPTQICAEAPAPKERGVPPSPRANCGRRPRQRDRRGNPKGGAALFGQSLPTFCWSESGGPRAARARRREN